MGPACRPSTWAVALLVGALLAGGLAVRADDEALLRQLQWRLESPEKKLQVTPAAPAPSAAPTSTTEKIRQLLERIEALEKAVDTSAPKPDGGKGDKTDKEKEG